MEENIQFQATSTLGQNSRRDLVEKAAHRFFQGDFKGAEWRGWLQDRGCAEDASQFTKDLGAKIDYNCVVNIGIGGSYLGCRAVYESLEKYAFTVRKNFKPLFFAGQQTDGDYHTELFEELKARYKPVFVIISKSGSTRETALATEEILERFSYLKDLNQRIVTVTEQTPKSSLYMLGQRHGWISFPVPEDVGGRYSLMTHAGMIPLALAGVDVVSLSQEFYAELERYTKSDLGQVLNYVQFRFENAESAKAIEILSYSQPKYFFLIEWLRQLYAESEAKELKGVMPVGMIYSTDLHSVGQLVQEGERNLFQTFLTFKPGSKLGASRFSELTAKIVKASKVAHEKGGVPCAEISINAQKKCDGLGAFLAFSMVSCAIYCIARGVNPFDQPGVEVYKAELK